ncbi:MAG: methyltransferase domain-containing protein [Chloroflexi bacterium]|nr:methyltransferase domain-containing protein [Chloroflexota bacterium]
MAVMRIRPGREKSLLRRHPWVFSGAVAKVCGDPQAGETVRIEASDGSFLAWGAYSPHSQIQARVWTWDEGEKVDAGFFRRRLCAALALRQALIPAGETSAERLVHGESDGLPGLVVDRYGDTLVAQFLSSGSEYWRSTLADLLVELSAAERLFERSDVDVRRLEGLPERVCPVRGDEPPDPLEIVENGLRFQVGVRGGHKTGCYLDQRRNRKRVRELAQGREVLDCFCYTGGFSTYALAGGATAVIAVDSSADALAAARANIELNGFPVDKVTFVEADVFKYLRTLRDQGRSFDMIILDPPKFAQTAAQAQRAARGYKDINLLALKLLRPGGMLVTFSCSGGVTADLFQKIVAGAALDSGREALIVEHLQQGPDHPVALNFPEGAYLKGLVVRVSS